MRTASAAVATAFASVGVLMALLLLIAFAAIHVVRDPNWLLETAHVAAVCALGYLAG